MITNIAHLCLAVENLSAMEDFYVNKLGLKKAFDFINEADGHRYGLYLKIGGRTFIELFEGKTPATPAGAGAYRHICLEVDDIEKTVAEMRARGADVSAPELGKDNAWQAWVSDPEGNAIELHCYTPAAWQTPHLA